MNFYKVFNIFLLFLCVDSQFFNATNLEQHLIQFRQLRNGITNVLGRTSENVNNMRRAKELNMLQEIISEPFPCNVTGHRSLKPPTNVNQVRPGDIDIIGALGDSLTAGNGLVATNIFQVFVENRGLSWCIGGQGNWRQYITLPNIIKEFNPNLIGYSLRDSITTDRESQFNPAEPAAFSSELPYMTKILIKRITRDPRVNLKQHWKLITIMIGSNNFCLNMCFQKNEETILNSHREDLIKVLRLIKHNLPRTIVNVVPPPNVRVILELKNKPKLCDLIHTFMECICLHSQHFAHKRNQFYEIIKKWQIIDEEVANMPEFHQNDFTVVFQPFLLEADVPKIHDNLTDFSYMSQDCFHVSQKTSAAVALSYWNNMLERVGKKTRKSDLTMNKFLCPSKENPYIFTRGNS